ncbi:hypothetical protein AMJ80_10965 [bacterium SM23_31]|nr:MAG: hypothetical protein AMJ80_10965 [bacterium SM23_31]
MKSGKKVYGIFGSPILHSLSPLMHNEAFAIKKLNAHYIPFEIGKSNLKAALQIVQGEGISGSNITLPLKQAVIEYLDDITPDARRIGAVNTVTFKDDKIKGYNTDIDGFIAPLKKYIEPIQYENVTVFGGGGAARTVLYALLSNYRFPHLTVITRNPARGNALLDEAETWRKHQTVLEWAGFDDVSRYSEVIWDSRLIINCTPLGMQGYGEEFPGKFVRFFRPGQVAYDLIYTPIKTLFISEAEKRGALTISGLDMLIVQGAKTFKLWTGKVMPVENIREILIEKL